MGDLVEPPLLCARSQLRFGGSELHHCVAEMIYLDYNATTPLAPEVAAVMRLYYDSHFGNASSIHRAGREARAAIDDARDRLAALLGAKPSELIFTGGGTEADNLAVIGLARSHISRGKHLITSTTEHLSLIHI